MRTGTVPAKQGTLKPHTMPALAAFMDDPGYTIGGATTGYRTGYDGPPRSRYCDNHPSAYAMRDAISRHITEELATGRLIRVTPLYQACPDACVIVSPMAAIDEGDKIRVVIDGSYGEGTSANGAVDPRKHPRVALAKPSDVADNIQRMKQRHPGKPLHMQVFDLQDAYKSCPVDPQDWWQLGIAWDGEIYWYIVDINGHRTAGIPLCLASTSLARALTARGFPSSSYVDDLSLISLASDDDKAEATFDELNGLIGTIKSAKKRAKAGPAGTLKQYIGFLFDLQRDMIYIPDKKLTELRAGLEAMINTASAKPHEIETLAGQLQWAIGAAPRLRPFVTPLRLLAQRRRGPGPIPKAIVRDLIFLRDVLTEFNGKSMLPTELAPPTATIRTDASRSGWGYWIEEMGVHAYGTWPAACDSVHINVLEAVVVVAAVRTAIDAGHRYLHVHTDNKTTQAALTSQSTSSARIWPVLREFARSVTLAGAHCTISHLEGAKNVEADGLSRGSEESLLLRAPHSRRTPAHPTWDHLLSLLEPHA